MVWGKENVTILEALNCSKLKTFLPHFLHEKNKDRGIVPSGLPAQTALLQVSQNLQENIWVGVTFSLTL